jgi:hypothetical protein
MRSLSFIMLCSSAPCISGCAVEREYLFNHNPITDTLIMVGGFFDSFGNSDLTDVNHSSDVPAEIHPL